MNIITTIDNQEFLFTKEQIKVFTKYKKTPMKVSLHSSVFVHIFNNITAGVLMPEIYHTQQIKNILSHELGLNFNECIFNDWLLNNSNKLYSMEFLNNKFNLSKSHNDSYYSSEMSILQYVCLKYSRIGGCRNIIKLLLSDKNNVNLQNKNADTALHVSCTLLLNNICNFPISSLLEAGANTNILNRQDETALIVACKNKNLNENTVKILLKAGADPNILKQNNDKHETALILACGNTNTNIVKKNIVERLLEAGADPNFLGKSQESKTALMVACSTFVFDENIVKLLLDKGSDINKTDHYGNTALMYACEYATKKNVFNDCLIRMLLKEKPDLSIKNCENQNAFDIFKKHNNKQVPFLWFDKKTVAYTLYYGF